MMVCTVTVLMIAHGAFVFAQDHEMNSEDTVVHRATKAWMDGSSLLP